MVDLSFLENLTKGNTSKMKRYISMYLNVAPDIFSRMDENIKEENWPDLAINAHSLKPQTDYMGIESLKTLLMEIEYNARNNEVSNIKQLYEQAFEIHSKSAVFLINKVQEI